jgi:hypothetical protein
VGAGEHGPAEVPARQLLAGLPARARRRLSADDGAKGPRSMTGPGSRWPGPAGQAGGSGCWPAGGCRDGELAFYAASARHGPRWPNWCGRRVCAGRWRRLSGRQKARSACGPLQVAATLGQAPSRASGAAPHRRSATARTAPAHLATAGPCAASTSKPRACEGIPQGYGTIADSPRAPGRYDRTMTASSA